MFEWSLTQSTIDDCLCVNFALSEGGRGGDKNSDSSERLALINSSEEMGQARDTSTPVTFNALNSTSSPRILDSLFMLFDRHEGEKKESSNVRLGCKLRN